MSWSAEVWQSWWGFPTRKATWLYFSKIAADNVELPFRLHSRRDDGIVFERMSKRQRSHTTPAFASWLVAAARMTAMPLGYERVEAVEVCPLVVETEERP